MLYIRVKYTMKHEEEIRFWQENQLKPGQKEKSAREEEALDFRGCPEVSVDIILLQHSDSCSIETHCSRRTLMKHTLLCLLKMIKLHAYMSLLRPAL